MPRQRPYGLDKSLESLAGVDHLAGRVGKRCFSAQAALPYTRHAVILRDDHVMVGRCPVRSFPLLLIAAVGAVPLTARAQTSASPPFVVNVLTAGDQVAPSAARDHRGHMVVVWTSATGDGDGTSVRGRRFDGRGQPSGGEFQVNTFTTGSQATAGARPWARSSW
jgi:hypothetical protein